MNSFFVHPQEHGPHPVVLFYMDAPGKREELHDMARRLASGAGPRLAHCRLARRTVPRKRLNTTPR